VINQITAKNVGDGFLGRNVYAKMQA